MKLSLILLLFADRRLHERRTDFFSYVLRDRSRRALPRSFCLGLHALAQAGMFTVSAQAGRRFIAQ